MGYNYPVGCSCHVSISTTQCILGQDRTELATPRLDGVLSIYIHLILPGPSLLQPVISKTSSVRGGTPREKKISQIFDNFCRRGGSEHTFFDAPVKCFDPIQEVLFINSKCNFGIKVGEYSKGGNGCNLFSNKFFFLSKESLIKLIIYIREYPRKDCEINVCLLPQCR